MIEELNLDMSVSAIDSTRVLQIVDVDSDPEWAAAIIGVIAAARALVVIYVLDDTIKTEEDIERYLACVVLFPLNRRNGM